jgi:hypothetical protein
MTDDEAKWKGWQSSIQAEYAVWTIVFSSKTLLFP